MKLSDWAPILLTVWIVAPPLLMVFDKTPAVLSEVRKDLSQNQVRHKAVPLVGIVFFVLPIVGAILAMVAEGRVSEDVGVILAYSGIFLVIGVFTMSEIYAVPSPPVLRPLKKNPIRFLFTAPWNVLNFVYTRPTTQGILKAAGDITDGILEICEELARLLGGCLALLGGCLASLAILVVIIWLVKTIWYAV